MECVSIAAGGAPGVGHRRIRRRWRFGSQGGSSLTAGDIRGPLSGVFCRCQLIEGILGRGPACGTTAPCGQFGPENLLQKRNAPAAAGSRPAAQRQLAGHLGRMQPHPIHQFPPRDMETVTDFVIQVHDAQSESRGWRKPALLLSRAEPLLCNGRGERRNRSVVLMRVGARGATARMVHPPAPTDWVGTLWKSPQCGKVTA